MATAPVEAIGPPLQFARVTSAIGDPVAGKMLLYSAASPLSPPTLSTEPRDLLVRDSGPTLALSARFRTRTLARSPDCRLGLPVSPASRSPAFCFLVFLSGRAKKETAPGRDLARTLNALQIGPALERGFLTCGLESHPDAPSERRRLSRGEN